MRVQRLALHRGALRGSAKRCPSLLAFLGSFPPIGVALGPSASWDGFGPLGPSGDLRPPPVAPETSTKNRRKVGNLRGPLGASGEPPGTSGDPQKPPPKTAQKNPKTFEHLQRKSKISGDLWEPLGSLRGSPRSLRVPPKAPESPRKPPNTSEHLRRKIAKIAEAG